MSRAGRSIPPRTMAERIEHYKLACELIDIGFKALAKEHHPDKGGSVKMMLDLNKARDRLKAAYD